MGVTVTPSKKRFEVGTSTIVSVDSTTQQLLVAANSDNAYVVSNTSNVRQMWLKPDDNTTDKKGILVGPNDRFIVPPNVGMNVYIIMDSGGSVDVSITELS